MFYRVSPTLGCVYRPNTILCHVCLRSQCHPVNLACVYSRGGEHPAHGSVKSPFKDHLVWPCQDNFRLHLKFSKCRRFIGHYNLYLESCLSSVSACLNRNFSPYGLRMRVHFITGLYIIRTVRQVGSE